MKLVLALAGALLLSLICENTEAQIARPAIYSISSETLTTAEFLAGTHGAPVALGGLLRLTTSSAAKQPAVILLHSAGGPLGAGGTYEEWSP